MITTIQGWATAKNARRVRQVMDLRGLEAPVFRCKCTKHSCGSLESVEHDGTVFCCGCGAPRPTLRQIGHAFWCPEYKVTPVEFRAAVLETAGGAV